METTTSYSTRIPELAAKIAAYAQARNWSLAKLAREFPSIGSERTFRDMQSGRTDGYNLEAQEANLAATAALINDLEETTSESRICEDLSTVLDVRRATLAAMSRPSDDNARVVLVRGQSGAGKSKAARVLVGRYGGRIALMEADQTMDGSTSAFLGEVLKALGKTAPAPSAAGRMAATVEALNQARRCLVIDEAHHLGLRNLNVLKTLVNRTPGEFILLALPKLWGDLERRAYQEAVQLTTNRLSECVTLTMKATDAAKYLAFSRPDLYPSAKAAIAAGKQIAEFAVGRGSLSFVRDVARQLSAIEPDTTDPDAEAKSVSTVIAIVRRQRGEGSSS